MRFTPLLLCVLPSLAHAQRDLVAAATPAIGRTVRVTDTSGALTTGVLRAVRPETLSVAATATTLRTFEAVNVRRFDVRVPLDGATRRMRGWFGIASGLVLGAGLGYIVAVPRVHATERRSDGAPLQQIEYVIDPTIGGIIGAAIGGVIGWRPGDRWLTRYLAPAT